MLLIQQNRRNHGPLVACGFFIAAAVYYAWLIFYFFPRTQLSKYPDAARLYQEDKLAPERLLDFSPLYFYLHFFVSKSNVIYWIQIFAVATSAAILFLILHKFFRTSVSIAGALLFMLDRSVNVYAQVFEPEIALILFTLLFVFFLYIKSGWGTPAAGLAFGLALLCRPVFLPVAFAIPWIFKAQKRDHWKRASLLFAAPVIACVGAIWLRNAVVLHHFSPYLMNPGTVFYEGNNPNSRGQSSIYPPLVNTIARELPEVPDAQHEVYRLIARRITGKQLSAAEVNRFWTGKAAAYLADHPARLFYLVRLKLFHIFHQYLWHDLANARDNEIRLQQAGVPALPFAWISAAALAGMFILRHRSGEILLFYLLFFCLVAVMILFYVSARQHVSLVFLFVFFASGTLELILQTDRRSALLLSSGILALGFLFFLQTDFMREEDHLWDGSGRATQLFNQSVEYRARGEWKEAAGFAAASAAAAPWNLENRRLSNLPLQQHGFVLKAAEYVHPRDLSLKFDEAYLLLEGGNAASAERGLTELLQDGFQPKRDFYQSSQLLYYLSRTKAATNRLDMLKNGLEKSPGDPWILADLFVLSGEPFYRDVLFRYFDDIDAHWYLAKAALRCNCNVPQAMASASYLTAKLPEYRNGWIYLAAAFSQGKRWKEAAQSYRHAIAMRSDPVLHEDEILMAFKILADENPQDAYAQYSYGFVLRQFGHFAEALEKQKHARSIDPENPQIKSEIDSLKRMEVKNE